MLYGTSIFDTIQTQEQKRQLLRELQTELLRMPSPNYKENRKIKFKFKENESTLQAEFYYFCKIKKIECHLQVKANYGILDAVININNKYYIIEFKYVKDKASLRKLIHSKSLKSQLINYIKEKCQVILLTNFDDISKLLSILDKYDFNEQIYFYNQEDEWLSPLLIEL